MNKEDAEFIDKAIDKAMRQQLRLAARRVAPEGGRPEVFYRARNEEGRCQCDMHTTHELVPISELVAERERAEGYKRAIEEAMERYGRIGTPPFTSFYNDRVLVHIDFFSLVDDVSMGLHDALRVDDEAKEEG